MKKLLFLAAALCALCACNRDETNGSGNSPDKTEIVPRFYGWMTLDNPSPETRGVANSSKVWSRPIAEKNLTVKFLNGTERYQTFVKEVAEEWSKYANVNFLFVPDDQDALVRVGFDYVKGMSSSWALTGTDHLQKYDAQDEATVHFAQWRRASDAAKRSDVLRAFGQVLGLELEFRHPNFNPGWITDADGNIDEQTIREYWEYELNELISWEELKKVVLDPLNVPAFLLEKTEYYDQESVMSWPFYEMIARNIPVVEFDEDYKTELSEQDKQFIKQLYGEPSNLGGPDPIFPISLITFDYTGTQPRITLVSTKKLMIVWDADEDDESEENITYIEPVDTTQLLQRAAVAEHRYTQSKTHRVVIYALLEHGQEVSAASYALKSFDLETGAGMENLNLRPTIPNAALSYVRIRGGKEFKAQQLDFTGNDYLKELYLTEIGDSKVTISDCPNLEVFATTPHLCKLNLEASGILDNTMRAITRSAEESPIPNFVIKNSYIPLYPMEPTDSLVIYPGDRIPIDSVAFEAVQPWPSDPLQQHSIDEKGLTILNCSNLKAIALENTHIKTFNFGNLPNLEYVYLSSTEEGIIGIGNNLRDALATLPPKMNHPGQIFIRGIFPVIEGEDPYRYVPLIYDTNPIDILVTRKNWVICWDPVFDYSTEDKSRPLD